MPRSISAARQDMRATDVGKIVDGELVRPHAVQLKVVRREPEVSRDAITQKPTARQFCTLLLPADPAPLAAYHVMRNPALKTWLSLLPPTSPS